MLFSFVLSNVNAFICIQLLPFLLNIFICIQFFIDFHIETETNSHLSSQARKDMASAFVNMSFYRKGEMREEVMFAGGDYARTGCSVSEVTDLYISVQKQTPMRLVVPIANLSQARANLAGVPSQHTITA